MDSAARASEGGTLPDFLTNPHSRGCRSGLQNRRDDECFQWGTGRGGDRNCGQHQLLQGFQVRTLVLQQAVSSLQHPQNIDFPCFKLFFKSLQFYW